VTSADFSPDATRAVTSSRDGTAILWDVSTGRALCVFEGHKGEVVDAVWSPNGQLVATASSDFTTKIWEAKTGNLRHTLAGHTSALNGVLFSPDGDRLMTISADYTARIWNPETGQDIFELKGHDGAINHAVYSPDGQMLATASEDGTIRLWYTYTGKIQKVLKGHSGGVNSLAFSPDGNYLASGADDELAIIWDVKKGKRKYVLGEHQYINGYSERDPFHYHSYNKIHNKLTSIAYSPDGSKLVTVSLAGQIILWNANKGKMMHFVGPVTKQVNFLYRMTDGSILINPEETINEVAFLPNGNHVATAGNRGNINVWDTESDRLIFKLTGHLGDVTAMKFSPDCRRMITASKDGTAIIWGLDNGKKLAGLGDLSRSVSFRAVSPDGSRLAMAYKDQTLRLWDTRKMEYLTIEETDGVVIDGMFTQDGKYLLTVMEGDKTVIWDTATGELLHSVSTERNVSPTSISAMGQFVTLKLWGYEKPSVWSVKKNEEVVDYNIRRMAETMGHLQNKNVVIMGFEDGTLKGYDYDSNRYVYNKDHADRGLSWNFAEFAQNTDRVLAPEEIDCRYGDDDKCETRVALFDTQNGEFLLYLEGLESQYASFQFLGNDDRYILSYHDDKIKLWESRSGRFIGATQTDGYVSSAVFIAESEFLTSHNWGKLVRWRLEDGQMRHIWEFSGGEDAKLCLTPDQKRVLALFQDGRIEVSDAHTGKLLYTYCVLGDNGYVVFDEQGHFDGSPQAMEKLYLLQGNKIIADPAKLKQLHMPALIEQMDTEK